MAMQIIEYDIKVSLMLHALGIEYTSRGKKVEPNTRYCPYPISYRNYYQISNCKDWNLIVSLGLARFIKGKESWQDGYVVTNDGMSYLRDLGYKFKIA